MTEQFVEKNWTKQFVNNIILTGQGRELVMDMECEEVLTFFFTTRTHP